MSKTKTGPLSIFRRPSDTDNIPAPWVPPELPVPKAEPGRAVAKVDRTTSPPAPWMPPELPVSKAAPVAVRERPIAKSKPWVPPAEAPQKLPSTIDDQPAVVMPDDEDQSVVVPQKPEKRRKKHQGGELTTETVQAGGQTTINIINQVAAPAPVVYAPWWGWWGGCPRAYCPRRVGRSCWNIFCGWW